MKTKLEIFCAYLPYDVQVFYDWMQIPIIKKLSGNNLSAIIAEEGNKLMLRPLSLLQNPMQHPVTGEMIENPAAWIAKKSCGNGLFICNYLTTYNMLVHKTQSRQIDAAALELHFDIYGAIEKGFAIEYGAAQ